jgi:hypothetical protein
MTSKLKRYGVGPFCIAAPVLLLAGAGAAQATVTEYTTQAAFNAAAPSANTFGFNAGGNLTVEPNPVTIGGLSFFDETTPLDVSANGSPVLFLVPASGPPAYGVDFLSYQNTQTGIVADVNSAGSTAIGFQYGSYDLPSGNATLTLSTGDTYTITPSTAAAFIGFTSTTPITSVSVNYPNNTTFDLVSVSVSAVPEPSTWAMMLVGLGGLGAMARSSRRRGTVHAKSAAAAT